MTAGIMAPVLGLRVKDITGEKFGRLTVRRYAGIDDLGNGTWECSCDCGGTKLTTSTKLNTGLVISCGSPKDVGLRNKKHGATIGGVWEPEYAAYLGIKSRAKGKKSALKKGTRGYSGMGCGISPEWDGDNYLTFKADMGPKPSPEHSVDRRDNSKGYSKENCFWGTPQQQASNRRTSVFIEYNGERLTKAEWSKRLGFGLNTITNRQQLGWPLERIMTTPIKKKPYRGKRQGWGWESEMELIA